MKENKAENSVFNFLSKIGRKGGRKTHSNRVYSRRLSQIAHNVRWAEVRRKKAEQEALVDNSI